MSRPKVGEVFVNPRGRRYTVVGHMVDGRKVVVQDSSGLMDLAMWDLMTPSNGWTIADLLEPSADSGNASKKGDE